MIVLSRAHQSTFLMRNLLLCSLGLLFACAGPASNPDSGSKLAPAVESGSQNWDNPSQSGAASASAVQNPNEIYLNSEAELAAVRRHDAMLADLAKRGIYPETKPTQVTVKYHRAGTTIGLYNDANVSQTDYYTTARSSATYKVIPNIEMGALLKALDDLGFYDEGVDGIKSVGGASVTVVVRRGTESHSLSWGAVMGKKNHVLTQTCANAVRVIFDTTLAVQVLDNPGGTDFFQNERNRIQNENARNAIKH
ncbi:MAG: hypothetical protein COA70_08765 [Planctomycetota bacterium]|nr:MAG: hypothetical protein COA70_08765 [Planctomycetota bacterium]